MKILSLFLQICKCMLAVLVVLAIIRAGVSPSTICVLLLVRLALRLVFQLIGGLFKIGFVFLILWLLSSIF